MSAQLDAFTTMQDTELLEVGNVSEESFLNDVHSAVDTGEGAPPKAEPVEPDPAQANPGTAPEPDPLFASSQPDPQPFFSGGQSQSIPVNSVISAEIAFNLVDKILPIGIVYILGLLDVKAQSKELQANAADKKIIVPVLDNAMKELKLNFDNPFVALGVVLVGCYGSKAMEIYMTREKEPKKPANTYTQAAEQKKGRGRPRKY